MNAYAGCDYVGADGDQGYPEIAAKAVRDVAARNPSPFYGYLRNGAQQKIYLFNALRDAQGWFDNQLQPEQRGEGYDYIAVFSATNLSAPMQGLDHFQRTPYVGAYPWLDMVGQDPYVGAYPWLDMVGQDPYVGCGVGQDPYVGCVSPQVGNVWPFLLGLPIGAAGGYFARRWQEPEAVRTQVPALDLRGQLQRLLPGGGTPSNKANVGAYPWLDMVGAYPWLDLVGQDPSVGAYPWLDIVGQDPSVGAYPWLDMVGQDPSVGAYPWLDIVGQDPSVGQWAEFAPWVGQWAEFAPWVGAEAGPVSAQARALIRAASQEVAKASAEYPSLGNYWVWTLAEPAAPSRGQAGSFVVHEPTVVTVPFDTLDAAMELNRTFRQDPQNIARAVFDKTSSRWPNPVAWNQSRQPTHEPLIAQYVASRSSTSTAGAYVGAWDTAVGAAIDDVRARARSMAQKRAGDVIGVIHTVKDNLWHALAFHNPDDADDWLNTATQDQGSFTYAAYFDKQGDSWPAPYIEKIGGYDRALPNRPQRGPIVGATRSEIDAYRARATNVATNRHGKAVVVLITSDNLAHSHSYGNLDEAIDALARVSGLNKSTYAYAAAFDKASDGSAHIQQEEFGEAYVPIPSGAAIPRDRPATTSGEWGGW